MLLVLVDLILEAYTLKPEVAHLTKLYDFMSYTLGIDNGNVKAFDKLHYISFNHAFFINSIELEIAPLLYVRQYSSSTQWEPQCGFWFLLQMLDSLVVHGVEQM